MSSPRSEIDVESSGSEDVPSLTPTTKKTPSKKSKGGPLVIAKGPKPGPVMFINSTYRGCRFGDRCLFKDDGCPYLHVSSKKRQRYITVRLVPQVSCTQTCTDCDEKFTYMKDEGSKLSRGPCPDCYWRNHATWKKSSPDYRKKPRKE